jgi:dienelactone hydrolase
MESDPEFDNGWDLPAARVLVEEAEDGELFLYPGDQHLFADSSLSSYDADAASLLGGRVLAFLDRIDEARPG